jgi:peptide subunit release factor 1 (eRF1)
MKASKCPKCNYHKEKKEKNMCDMKCKKCNKELKIFERWYYGASYPHCSKECADETIKEIWK